MTAAASEAQLLPHAAVLQRAQAWFRSVPDVSKCTFGVCVALAALQMLSGLDLTRAVCLSLTLVTRRWQAHRVLLSHVVHGGALHVALNMAAFLSLAPELEHAAGSVRFGYTLLALALLQSALSLMLAAALAATLWPAAASACAAGLSGVVMALVVLHVARARTSTLSVFGTFDVPARWYPWVLLGLFQLLAPNASFIGHLAGLLAGVVWLTPAGRALRLPAVAVHAAEGACGHLHSRPTFVLSTDLPTSSPCSHLTAEGEVARRATDVLPRLDDFVGPLRGCLAAAGAWMREWYRRRVDAAAAPPPAAGSAGGERDALLAPQQRVGGAAGTAKGNVSGKQATAQAMTLDGKMRRGGSEEQALRRAALADAAEARLALGLRTPAPHERVQEPEEELV